MAHIRLGELLVRAGHLSEGGLERALEEQRKWGGRLGRILREMNLVAEDVLLKALTKQTGMPRADLRAPNIPQAILANIDPQFAMEHRLCPERFDANTRTLLVAMEDHLDLPALDQVAAKTGSRVKTSLAASSEIDAALAALYPGHSSVAAVRPDKSRTMPFFETKDFSKAAAAVRGDDAATSTVRMLQTGDFSEAASEVKDEGLRPGTMQNFGTDDFSEAAGQVRDDED